MDLDNLDKTIHAYFPYGFQISAECRRKLNLEAVIGQSTELSKHSNSFMFQQISTDYNKTYKSPHKISSGELLTVSLIVDILRYVFHSYCFESYPESLPNIFHEIEKSHGKELVHLPVSSFINLYPPSVVWNKLKSEKQYLSETVNNIAPDKIITAELTLLYLDSMNPAFKPFDNFYNDEKLKNISNYDKLIKKLEAEFEHQPVFKPLGLSLFASLKAPMLASPDSLDGQLSFIKEKWSFFLPVELINQLLFVLDIIKEEQTQKGFGPGKIEALTFIRKASTYDDSYPEPAMFSRDADWMPNVVLIAKTVFVWLDQLSKKYQRNIKHLDEIPDEELDCLANWGFTGLWLIGIWERSRASQTIKKIMGNPEAAPSAYSLYDYNISPELGGLSAFQNLKHRAWLRGIRLASDMVPNHMGIYSKWIVEHPDWFQQLDYPPYPGYQFTGVNLSDAPHLNIQIEDGYWQHRDASVVFKRTDYQTGEVRYIYHGNDGTSTPWNDTAQLNFMIPGVREAVIQTILHVASLSPIIRFDAAMTLAKKHYQRLWYPKPGDGGAIPSRSEYGMSKQEFDEAFPKEFWREVVDRIASEAPDTLLLAEAFWLMEGYFVRSLGMHRVYNSAFMNMLKTEDNANYRITIKNVLEFSPEILKRFVNFMNNPDEESAVEQFGKDDKYFGVAIMMATMPGLPMFGHGQFEGFKEKYGMEYYKAYLDEYPDENLIRRHENEISPILKKRYLFSGSTHFAFFDFIRDDNNVDENVFAYSNKTDYEKSLIIFNNAYNTTHGVIHTSTAINENPDGEKQSLIRINIADALGLDRSMGSFYSFMDHRTKLTYLYPAAELAEKGLHLRLFGYQYYAFIGFKHIQDYDGSWYRLYQKLNNNGVHNLDETYQEMIYEPLLIEFNNLFSNQTINEILEAKSTTHKDVQLKSKKFIESIIKHYDDKSDPKDFMHAVIRDVKLILKLHTKEIKKLFNNYEDMFFPTIFLYILVSHLQKISPVKTSTSLFQEILLAKHARETLHKITGNENLAYLDTTLVDELTSNSEFSENITKMSIFELITELADEEILRRYLKINRHDNIDWFNKEQFERFTSILILISALYIPLFDTKSIKKNLIRINSIAEKSEYKFDKLLKLLKINKIDLM